jgi:hypothetical protein
MREPTPHEPKQETAMLEHAERARWLSQGERILGVDDHPLAPLFAARTWQASFRVGFGTWALAVQLRPKPLGRREQRACKSIDQSTALRHDYESDVLRASRAATNTHGTPFVLPPLFGTVQFACAVWYHGP